MPQYVELFPKTLFRSRKPGSFRILVIGNYQAKYIAPFFEFALADCVCDYLLFHLIPEQDQHAAIANYLDESRSTYQLIVTLPLGPEWHAISRDALSTCFGRDRLFFIFSLGSTGLFPDETGLGDSGSRVLSPMGGSHSRIALGGWMAQLSVPEILSLFTTETMAKLGFLDMVEQSESDLRRQESNCDTDFAAMLIQCVRSNFALYTVNHPTPNLIAIYVTHIRARLVARGQARSSGIPLNSMLASETLISHGAWPVYPELKDLVMPNFPVSAHFILPKAANGEVIHRDVFVQRSIAHYERVGRERMADLTQATDAHRLIQRIERP
jgi:hypothetical protein